MSQPLNEPIMGYAPGSPEREALQDEMDKQLSEVIEKALGPAWRKGVDICIALTCLGALLSYYNVIGSLGSDLLKGLRHEDGNGM